MQAEQSKFNIVWSGMILILFIFFQLQLIVLKGNPEISQFYLDKYIPLGWFCIIISAISLTFIWVKEPLIAHLPSLATTDSYRPIKWNWLKFVIIGLFAISILFSVTTLKIQIMPIPHPIEVGYTVSPITEAYYSSIIPGFYEDFTWGIILPSIIFNVLWLIILLTLKIDARQSVASFIGVMLIAILISSIGYGLLIPGFATAHKTAYQENIQAYLSAFFFMFIQSFIYAITGLFLPIAHIIHNALFSLGFVIAFSVGGVSSALIFLTLKKRRKGNEE
jgi:hypothetical protein